MRQWAIHCARHLFSTLLWVHLNCIFYSKKTADETTMLCRNVAVQVFYTKFNSTVNSSDKRLQKHFTLKEFIRFFRFLLVFSCLSFNLVVNFGRKSKLAKAQQPRRVMKNNTTTKSIHRLHAINNLNGSHEIIRQKSEIYTLENSREIQFFPRKAKHQRMHILPKKTQN